MKYRFVFSLIILLAAAAFVPSGLESQQSSGPVRKVVTQVLPQYPSLARTMNIERTVRAEILVAPNGKVKSIDIKGGHPLLAQAALEALREWKWEPDAHESRETVELKFHP